MYDGLSSNQFFHLLQLPRQCKNLSKWETRHSGAPLSVDIFLISVAKFGCTFPKFHRDLVIFADLLAASASSYPNSLDIWESGWSKNLQLFGQVRDISKMRAFSKKVFLLSFLVKSKLSNEVLGSLFLKTAFSGFQTKAQTIHESINQWVYTIPYY